MFLAWFPVVMRYGALAGVFHQAIYAKFDRPALLALYGAMLGLSEIAAAFREAQQRIENPVDEEEAEEERP